MDSPSVDWNDCSASTATTFWSALMCNIKEDELDLPEYKPWTEEDAVTEVEYYEYECGSYCSPDGCCGHVTTFPVGFFYKGFMFYVDGYKEGDFPQDNKQENADYQKAFHEIIEALEDFHNRQKRGVR